MKISPSAGSGHLFWTGGLQGASRSCWSCDGCRCWRGWKRFRVKRKGLRLQFINLGTLVSAGLRRKTKMIIFLCLIGFLMNNSKTVIKIVRLIFHRLFKKQRDWDFYFNYYPRHNAESKQFWTFSLSYYTYFSYYCLLFIIMNSFLFSFCFLNSIQIFQPFLSIWIW